MYTIFLKTINTDKIKKMLIKETVSRYFRPLVFSHKSISLGPWVIPKNIFELCFEFAEIFAMLHSAESIFRQFVAEYLGEFETEFENILGCQPGA
jgi:hypothetical protein